MPFDPTDIDSTPYGAPLVPSLPIRLRRTEILTVVYRTDRAAADALIPSPLELAGDLCVVHVYRMHDAEWFGVYCESAFQIPVVLPDGSPAVYSPFLVLESDGAVAAGRELYGQPKKAGQVSLAPDGDLLVGRVARNGIEIATATTVWKQRAAAGGELERLVPGAAVNVNLRVLPEDGCGDAARARLAHVRRRRAARGLGGPGDARAAAERAGAGAPAGRARGRARAAPRARPLAAAGPRRPPLLRRADCTRLTRSLL